MLTHAAVDSVYWLFEQALTDNATAGADDQVVVTREALAPLPDTPSPGQVVVLNISSYLFRIVALFDFAADAPTQAHLARRVRSLGATLQGQPWLDALCEMVNMICGSVNRGLGTTFRHAAMSTPFVLERHCGRYIGEIKPDAQETFVIRINDAVQFSLTLCLCSAAGSTVDFQVEKSIVQAEEAGEMELF